MISMLNRVPYEILKCRAGRAPVYLEFCCPRCVFRDAHNTNVLFDTRLNIYECLQRFLKP